MPYSNSSSLPRAKKSALSVLALLGLVVGSGCTTASLDDLAPSTAISPKLAREVKAKGFREQDAVLVRIFKEESELEVWKKKASGQYALFKTYPICRWSGKLGPKKKNGDRQAPEGFYQVSTGMLNPKSQYYLSFNLGYPNRLEDALGYSGEALMVHGACSSSGCYAMSDQGVSEIYALANKALRSGQQQFQVQAYPFRMSTANMSRHTGDPNMAFWRDLKVGYDSFGRTKQELKISTCGGRYVVNKNFPSGEPTDPLAACPADINQTDSSLLTASTTQEHKTPEVVTSYASAYADGGMHSSFRQQLKDLGAKRMAARVSTIKYPISRPEAALSDPFERHD
ncbi:murein L,D-transpeptidase [Rhizobium sp. KVB221]|uniref:Murein L,D-transpeptidase n=1 Tax=Rhizobium setariae TaxID=2801340 RepID=A0A936YM47_9HYPH|nr:murein L,D-transpeptidase family protein [Rhizobium setariae]MBL0372913.1 murein L,D-transpeptidase [Rhizobium setariae]